MNSDLRPAKDHRSDPEKTLFIGRLNGTTDENTIRMHFERFGDIRSLFLIRDVLTGDSRRYAFIEFRRAKDADRAYAEGHNTLLDGRRILVDRELGRTEKNWKPRRFGGGFGGQKESGQMRFGGRSTIEHRGFNNNNNSNDHRSGNDRTFRTPLHHRSIAAPYPQQSSSFTSRRTNGIDRYNRYDHPLGAPMHSSSTRSYSNGHTSSSSSSYRHHSTSDHHSGGGGGPIRSNTGRR
nr:U11/U12 small nuclear ribonucleoprotein 35 kDa protein-like [Dermatophagoides farinae]